MKYSIEKKEQYTLLTLQEEKLDAVLAPQLKSEFTKLVAEGEKNLIVDLSETKYCDSSGLSALLVGQRSSKESEGSFILTNLSEHVEKLVKISQLESVLTIMPTNHEAIEYVFMEEIERNLGDESE